MGAAVGAAVGATVFAVGAVPDPGSRHHSGLLEGREVEAGCQTGGGSGVGQAD